MSGSRVPRATRSLAYMTLATALGLAACGHAGSGAGGGTPQPAGPPGTVQPGVTAVTGTFFYGSAAVPAKTAEVWLFDQTARSLTRIGLDVGGAFSRPVATFVTGHTYSFHLVEDDRLLGDLALSVAVPGTQTAFQYEGGEGFDLGQVIIPVDAFGKPLTAASGLIGQLGGGFSLEPAANGAFNAFPAPAALTRLQLGSQLFVFDAETLLYSFYARAVHPDLYARDVQRLSRIGGVATAAAAGGVTRVFVAEAGSWLAAARQPPAADVLPEASPLWAATDDSFVQSDTTHFSASVYSAGLPPAGEIALIRVQPASGAEAVVPLTPPRIVTYPPELTAVSGAGGAATAVDYTATTAANGLTMPFCQSGEVVLDLAPPLDGSGQPIPATTLNWIDATVDWYQVKTGQTVVLPATAAQLPAPYNAALTDTAQQDVTRTWNPATMTAHFVLDAVAAGAAAPEIRLWSGLFPPTIGTAKVSGFRLRVVYGSDTEATRGGLVVWFKTGC